MDLACSVSTGVQILAVRYAKPAKHETGRVQPSAESISISQRDMARWFVSDSDNRRALKESIRVDVDIDVFAESFDVSRLALRS